MVGLIEEAKHITTQSFKEAGDAILLLGNLGDEMGGSHYLKVIHGRKAGSPPRLDYDREKALHETLRSLIKMGLVKSAHDCSEGGLAVALAESCMSAEGGLGAEIDLSGFPAASPAVLLFNESQSRAIVSVRRENAAAALALAEWRGVPARRLGLPGGRNSDPGWRSAWSWPVEELKDAWWNSLAKCMEDAL